MAWALVFSGQGTQHLEMLRWLAHDETLAQLDQALGIPWRTSLDGLVPGAENRRTQLLLTGTACAAWRQLSGLVEPPAIVAGYSVGELSACAAVGVFDATTALHLAGARADSMDAAVAGVETGLLALGGTERDGVDRLCKRHDLEVAIRIDEGTVVVGGLRSSLALAADEAQARGWRVNVLNIALASHTRWMSRAAGAFAHHLAAIELAPPTRPLLSNSCGRLRSAGDVRHALAHQLDHPVRWDICMEAIHAQRINAVLEIGPGQALARLWHERFDGVSARSADEFGTLQALVRWLERMGSP